MQNKALGVLEIDVVPGVSLLAHLCQHGSQYPELQAQEQCVLLTLPNSAQTHHPHAKPAAMKALTSAANPHSC